MMIGSCPDCGRELLHGGNPDCETCAAEPDLTAPGHEELLADALFDGIVAELERRGIQAHRDYHGLSPYLDFRTPDYPDITGHPTSLGRSGLDTPSTDAQTTDMRSTEDDDICDHRHVERDDDGEFGRRFFCLDCQRQVIPDGPDEDGQGTWEVID